MRLNQLISRAIDYSATEVDEEEVCKWVNRARELVLLDEQRRRLEHPDDGVLVDIT